jgi:hypothetical protein
MKILILSVALLLPVFAFADTNLDEANKWMKELLPRVPSQGGKGRQIEGTTCNLNISLGTMGDQEGKLYMLVVSDNTISDKNERHVGVKMEGDVKVEVTGSSYSFERHSSWGNSSSYNKVIIDVDGSGYPTHLTGINDTRPATSCDVKQPQ